MKKIALILFSSLVFAVCSVGQNLRPWTAGPLTWDDFQAPGYADSSATSHAAFSLIRENKKIKTKGTIYKYRDIRAAIDPSQSWVKPEGKNDGELQARQQEFDILQYYATLYRDDFMFYDDTVMSPLENYFYAEAKHNLPVTAYMDQFKAAVEEFRKTGDASAYPVSREPFDITRYPCRIASGASESHIAFFTVIPTGVLSQTFTPASGFSAGYGYREGKGYFNADVYLGVVGLEFTGFDWRSGGGSFVTRGSYLGATAKYGRILYSSGRVALSLFAGAGYTSWKKGALVSEPFVNGLTLTEGVCLDVHLRRTFDYLAKSPRARDMGLQFRLYADEMYYGAQNKVLPTFNISVGLNYDSRKLFRIR